MTKMKNMDMNLIHKKCEDKKKGKLILGPDNVLSKHAVDHDHHGSNQFETPVQKNVDLQHEKKTKRTQSWCECLKNRRWKWCC